MMGFIFFGRRPASCLAIYRYLISDQITKRDRQTDRQVDRQRDWSGDQTEDKLDRGQTDTVNIVELIDYLSRQPM
jgi:hypothetical protein